MTLVRISALYLYYYNINRERKFFNNLIAEISQVENKIDFIVRNNS